MLFTPFLRAVALTGLFLLPIASVHATTVIYTTAYDLSGEGGGKVVEINASGVAIDYVTGLEFVRGIAQDSLGNLLVVDNDVLWKINGRESKTALLSDVAGFDLWDIAVDGADNIYVAGSDSMSFTNRIYRFSAASNYEAVELWDMPEDAVATGLTIGPGGDLFVAGDTIYQYNMATGAATAYYELDESITDTFAAFDLVFDTDGSLLISGWVFEGARPDPLENTDFSDKVLRLSADRTSLTEVITEGMPYAMGLTLDADGKLYIANWQCDCDDPNAVMSWSGSGTQAVVFSDLGDFSPNYVLATTVTPIPEPSLLGLVALAPLLWYGRRLRRNG